MAASFKPCSVNGCKANAHWRSRGARGLCNAHYIRLCRHGAADRGGRPRQQSLVMCTVDGCEQRPVAIGLCSKHYQRQRKTGSTSRDGTAYGERLALLKIHANYSGQDCLIWPFCLNKGGYGAIVVDGVGHNAPRIMCSLAHGVPPSPIHEAAHECGNRKCCNPKHLRWDTRSGNFSDKVEHGTDNRGAKNPLARLTEDDVREIRRLKGIASLKSVARRFGIHVCTVSDIQSRRDWGWLE